MKQKHYYPVSRSMSKTQALKWLQRVRHHYDKLGIKMYLVRNKNISAGKDYEIWRESHPKDYKEKVMQTDSNAIPPILMTRHEYYMGLTNSTLKPSCVTNLDDAGSTWEGL